MERQMMTLQNIAEFIKNTEAQQQWQQMQAKRRWRMRLAAFFAGMLLMTFVCRIIYSEQLPKVDWGYAHSGALNYKITAEGIVSVSSPSVVYGLEGLRVEKICVSEGEQIKRGDVLYLLDTADLEQKLAALQAEHGTWQHRADNWYEDARTETAWYEAEMREYQMAAWQKLIDAGGRVNAEEEGTVLEVLVQVGNRMDGGPVFRYGTEQSEHIFQAEIGEDQKSLVHLGDKVTVKFSGNKKETEGTIDWIEEENGGYLVTVWLQDGEGVGELQGTMTLDYTSQVYEYVIPIEALHQEDGICCIYILKEKTGILGTELSAEKVNVRLLEKSLTQAAIEEEVLESGMKIITEADKAIKAGEVVREQG